MMPLFLTLIIALITIPALAPSPAQAEDPVNIDQPQIIIEQPYAFATMPGGITGATFMIIKNVGNQDDTLIKVQSDIAEITEIHENMIDPDDGKMMMRKIKNIKLPQKNSAILEPKGKHIMLIKLKEPLTLDSTFPLTLIFEKSEKQEIDVEVIQPGGTPNTMSDMPHHH